MTNHQSVRHKGTAPHQPSAGHAPIHKKNKTSGQRPGTDAVLNSATEILTQGEKTGAQLYSRLHVLLDTSDLNEAERAKVTALVTGVCEHQLSIDYVLNHYSKTKTEKMKPQMRAVLRLGVCQILFMERTPDAVAVSNCVNQVRACGFSALTGYVNGVLRTIAREKETIVYPDLSTRYSMPVWICERLEEKFGRDEQGKDTVGSILAYFEQENSLTIRLDERLDEQQLQSLTEALQAASQTIRLRKHPLLSRAYILERAGDIRQLPGFAQGSFYVQDAGAQLIVELAGIRRGDTVIDVCAAPGGKSLHAYTKCREADVGNNSSSSGRVVAMDLTERKCDLIRANAKRMHADAMEIYAHDARVADERLMEQADVVICDLPCSGLGVMGRKADIRYRLQEKDILELASLQKEILRASIRYLKKGGCLIYSTCTLTFEENEQNALFIREELGLVPVDLTKDVYEVAGKESPLSSIETLRDGMLTLPPGRFLTDGFFMAKFQKVN